MCFYSNQPSRPRTEGSHLEMDVWYKDVRVVVGLAEPKQRGRQLAMRHLNEDQGVKLSMARGAGGAKQLKRAREHSSSQALSRLSRPFAGQYRTWSHLPACLPACVPEPTCSPVPLYHTWSSLTEGSSAVAITNSTSGTSNACSSRRVPLSDYAQSIMATIRISPGPHDHPDEVVESTGRATGYLIITDELPGNLL